jgi:uncharacterized protein
MLRGAVGEMELFVDFPEILSPRGVVLLAHPQPLLGGHAEHKVPQFLAKACVQDGYIVIRPNFRGVGRSEGEHDFGEGETEDLLILVKNVRVQWPQLPLILAGFSFGAFVQAKVAKALELLLAPANKTVLAGMPFGVVGSGRSFTPPQALLNAMVIHGEYDERVSLAAVLDWARPHQQVIRVMPGADHFFSGKLHLLKQELLAFIRA